jgi:hypothetical protein
MCFLSGTEPQRAQTGAGEEPEGSLGEVDDVLGDGFPRGGRALGQPGRVADEACRTANLEHSGCKEFLY